MASRREEEGLIAGSWANKAAARALRRARESAGAKQYAFAGRIYQTMGLPFKGDTYGAWERGERTMPAGALLAGAMLSGRTVDELLEPLEDQPVFNAWLGQGLGDLRHKVAMLHAQVEELRSHRGMPDARSAAEDAERGYSTRDG